MKARQPGKPNVQDSLTLFQEKDEGYDTESDTEDEKRERVRKGKETKSGKRELRLPGLKPVVIVRQVLPNLVYMAVQQCFSRFTA